MDGSAMIYLHRIDSRKSPNSESNQHTVPDSPNHLKGPTHGSTDWETGNSASTRLKGGSGSDAKPTKAKPTNVWHRHFQDRDAGSKIRSHETPTIPRPTRLDIIQSKWIHHPHEDREIVTLDIKNEHEAESTRKSFRWIHHRRNLTPVAFAEFQRYVADTHGLFEGEVAAATKCLKEVKLGRKISARGRYFDHTVHQAVAIDRKDDKRVPVRATFISMPIFALFHDQIAGSATDQYPSSREIRTSDHHPVRSLLQHSNILALGSERDREQVITKVEGKSGLSRPFIQVPEMWALIINMYTMITCAPFDIEQLQGENLGLRFEAGPEGGTRSLSKDTRTIVKYTDLNGTLRDLECRQWHSLINYIARIEGKRAELTSLLNDSRSEYKIVDLKFAPVDKARWIDIVDSQYDHPEFVHLRLIKLADQDVLSLQFAQDKLKTYISRSIVLAASRVSLRLSQQKLVDLRRDRASSEDIDKLKSHIEHAAKRTLRLKRSQYFNLLMLYATRYHLIYRERTTKNSWIRQKRQQLVKGDHLIPSSRGKSLRPSRPNPPYLQLSPETSRPSSPVGPTSSHAIHASDNSSRRSSADSYDNNTHIPHIMLNDESLDSSIVNQRPEKSRARLSTSETPSNTTPFPGTRNQLEHGPASASSADLRERNPLANINNHGSASDDRLPPISLRRSSTSAFGAFSKFEIDDLSDSNDGMPLLARPATIARRHSTSSDTTSVPNILDASPLRSPLDVEADPALRIPPRQLRPPNKKWRRTISGMSPPHVEQTKRPQMQAAEDRGDAQERSPAWDLTEIVAERCGGTLARLNPFFEWRSAITPSGSAGKQGHSSASTGAKNVEPQSAKSDEKTAIVEDAMQILDSIDNLVARGRYFDSVQFPVGPEDYDQAPMRNPKQIIELLEAQRRRLYTFDEEEGPTTEIGEELEFFDVKTELFLSVYGLLRCFIHQDRHRAKVISKIWGVVYDICELTAKEHKPITLTHRHEIAFVKLATLQMRKFEVECCDLLKDVRPDSGEDETAVPYSLPQSLLPAFRNIVVYLLCAWKATTRWGVESEHITLAQDRTYDLLREADDAFVRMREHAEAEDDKFAGEESIRTADTLLALLVGNAFDISDREDDSNGGPYFDLRHVYSKYTAQCITRAKDEEASARIYKDVRLLLEEIRTICAILKQQRDIFKDMFKKRESAMQKIDHRVERRTLAHLEDTRHHFEKLLEHAQQAQFWTGHSIEVRSEDNSKAIYVFTAVTVIFLPLSFVAGILGMNTEEIRSTKDKQWLFWVVAVPLTGLVLVTCLAIVRWRFMEKRRWGRESGWTGRWRQDKRWFGRWCCWRKRRKRTVEIGEADVESV